MSQYKEKIVDVITGEEIWRDYTDAEIAEAQKAQAEAAAEAAQLAQKKADRKAILEKLGLTEEEAAVLLG